MDISMNIVQQRSRSNSPKSPLSLLFPVDGQKKALRVLNRPASLQLYRLIQSFPNPIPRNIIPQKMLELYGQLVELSICQVQKSVCAKLVKYGETIVQCHECRVDKSCIICMDCFKNGNHKGHSVVFKKASGGCCDCGDSQAWKEQGFCSKHSGKEKEIMIDEKQIKTTNEILFQLYYLYVLFKLTKNRAFKQFFEGFFNLLTRMARSGLKGMKLVATFLNSEIPKRLTVCSKISGKILQQLMNIQFSGKDFGHWQDLFIEMFPYYTFKQQLISSYVKCFNLIYARQSDTGLSISCQIMTSYKLVEDYADSNGAVPIIVNQSEYISQVQHLTRMLIQHLNSINSLQGNAPLKYWKMQLKYGIEGLFGYYQSLKMLARKQKFQAAQMTSKQLKKDKQTQINKLQQLKNNLTSKIESQSVLEDTSFSILEFLKRNNKLIELQHTIIQQFLIVLPIIAKQDQLVSLLIKNLADLISKQSAQDDNLIIFRPYERIFALVCYYMAQQTPLQLTSSTIRQKIRNISGLGDTSWPLLLGKIQRRLTQTLGFYTYIQTHQNQKYHQIFYVFIVIYCSQQNLLGYVDILGIKEMILLGASEQVIKFESLAQLQQYGPNQKWNFKILSNLLTELGLIYIGHFSELYISHHPKNGQIPKYIQQESKLLLKKFIISAGGSISFEKILQFSHGFISNNEEIIKDYLKSICNFNKTRKLFELSPNQIDKNNPMNFKDFGLRAKNLNQNTQAIAPASTLQFIERQNKIVLNAFWNKKNIESLCYILLQTIDEVVNKKSKDELVSFYSIPCRLSLFLKSSDVPKDNFASLTELLQNLDVSSEIRKALGPLASELSSIIQSTQMNEQQAVAEKQLQRQKKLKKLEQLKKKKIYNLQKIKQIHELSPSKLESTEQYCVICRKTGGNLVWVSRLCLRNLQSLFRLGEGVLTLSFKSCYHAFDYQCIMQASIKRSSHQILFRCPVCRTLGNALININLTSQSGAYVDAFLERVLQVTLTLRNYEQFNITQQLLKAFYHYILLGYVQPQYTHQKRLNIYKQLIRLLINSKLDIEEVEKKLQQKKLSLIPKMAKQYKQKVNLKEVQVREIQDYQEEDFSEEDLQIWMIDRSKKIRQEKVKMEQEQVNKKLKQTKPKPKPKNENVQLYSKIFYYTLKRIIKHIKNKRIQKSSESNLKQQVGNQSQPKKQIQKMDLQAQIQYIDTKQVPDWVIYLLDQLLDNKQKMICEWNPPKLIKFNLLPEKYYWDMTQNTCDYCNNICNDFFLCMLCEWKGCLNNCKEGGFKKHNKNVHGQDGAFLSLKDATVYFMSPGENKKAGCLYVNEWGQDFKIKDDWRKYYLQTSVVDQVISLLIKDE